MQHIQLFYFLKKKKPIKIILADTDFAIGKRLRTLVSENKQFEYVAEAKDDKDLTSALAKYEADVLIVDHCCEECFSLEAVRNIKEDNPALNILMIYHKKTAEEINKMINTGIKNYLLKDCEEGEIIDAIKACAKGEKYFCRQTIEVLLEKRISGKDHFLTGRISKRETDIIKQLVTGKKPKEIAGIMNLSYHTVVKHKRNIYTKLGITNRIELIQFAAKSGLIK